MTFAIQENIPVPKYQIGIGKKKYPFGEMKVGDSFWAPVKRSAVIAAASNYGTRHSKKFISKVESVDGIKGTRIWRVE